MTTRDGGTDAAFNPSHRLTRCPYGLRGCPDCTGLTWSQLADIDADREFNLRDRAAIESTTDDWSTR